ncbi:hypothetical protein [Microtetraspora sp. NBRC 16547]|uniref:hypothetical protein n=1 Tax=Microtetraspora sp. NBRC 16547 TaxID=3030993 RepID=UPI0024A296AC|nr:hypothetical protein [Microtetraspora sp. NBRC 16547]GLW99633.1 hypothetical protein Misp02_37200 [Microtetraspora sp. NBRC 16547]
MKNSTVRTPFRTARRAGAAALLAVVAGTLAAPADAAAARLHWGPVQSRSDHGGYATADVWITDFSAETFVVSGTLYDRDGHRDHCAYIRARFHYPGGGTGWARPRTTCAAKSSFQLSSDGEITRVDVKVCVLDRAQRATLSCYVDPIKAETVANWPR